MKILALLLLAPLTLQLNQRVQETMGRYDENKNEKLSMDEMVDGLGKDMGTDKPNP